MAESHRGQPDPNLSQVSFGVLLVVLAVIFLLASLDLLQLAELFRSGVADVLFAFFILSVGLIYVFGFLNPR